MSIKDLTLGEVELVISRLDWMHKMLQDNEDRNSEQEFALKVLNEIISAKDR